jgi:hypothetical protein
MSSYSRKSPEMPMEVPVPLPIVSDGLQTARSSQDPRVDDYRRAGSQSLPAPAGAAVLVDVNAAVGQQNSASAASDLGHLAAANTLVKQLVAQLASQPAGAHPAQRSPSPQAVLSLLS